MSKTKQLYNETTFSTLRFYSALFVVDLVRFRKLMAGDIIRSQYQALSQDPNSLANLDQDLPNNIQQLVPIHSLPQDWLACESWCSPEAMKRAKTIDLCSDPLSKEPKLDRAKKLPEWQIFDTEIKVFLEKLKSEKNDLLIEHDEL